MNRVSARWRDLGLLLGLSLNQLDAWDEQYRGNATTCWTRVMDQWLGEGGTRDYPASWEGLYDLLEDAEHAQTATALKAAVDSAIRHARTL